jgi:hypothetical protein
MNDSERDKQLLDAVQSAAINALRLGQTSTIIAERLEALGADLHALADGFSQLRVGLDRALKIVEAPDGEPPGRTSAAGPLLL